MAEQVRERYAYVQYAVAGEPWHEHYVAKNVDFSGAYPLLFVIYTADGDLYMQELGPPSVTGVHAGGPLPRLPHGLGANRGQPVYRFARPWRRERWPGSMKLLRLWFWLREPPLGFLQMEEPRG